MDTYSIAGAVVRRWWIVVPILLVTAGAAYVLGARVPPEYTASGSAVVLVREDEPEAEQVSAAVVAELIQDRGVDVSVDGELGLTSYTATASGDDFVEITARSPRPRRAVRIVRRLLRQLGPTLAEREEAQGIPAEGRREVELINRPWLPDQISSDPPRYEATGTARLYSAGAGGEPAAQDGVESIGGETALSMLRRELRDADVVASLGAEPFTGYSIDGDGPLLIVSATGDSSEATVATVDTVLATAPDVLEVLQDNTHVDARFQIQPFRPAELDAVDGSPSVRAVIALTGVGVAVAVMAAVAVDVILASRRRRRQQRSTVDETDAGASTRSRTRDAVADEAPRPASSRPYVPVRAPDGSQRRWPE